MKTTTYKQTEIGLIPVDWEVKSLSNLISSNPDYGINAAAIKFDDKYPTYLRITDIDDEGRFIKENMTSVNNINSDNYYLNENELVFARTGASVGKTYLYNPKDGKLVFAGFLIRLKPDATKLYPKFLFYCTQTNQYKNWIVSNSMRSGQPGINSNEIKTFQIPLPPLPEQTAIAEALSDADAFIESLEQLIAKKRLLKQGAMQTLLTPAADWELKKLGEVCKSIASGKSNTSSDGELYPIFGSTNIIGYKNYYEYSGNNMTVARVGANAGLVNIIDGFYCISDNTLLIIPDDLIDVKLLYYSLKYKNLNQLVFGSGQPLITGGQLKDFEINIPKSKKEQTRIATILSDMDAELEALEAQLEKAKQIKQGMMQELLTGRVRLV
jgi:type I restriction enzyme S subunit